MRTTLIAFLLASFLPACDGTIAPALQASSTVTAGDASSGATTAVSTGGAGGSPSTFTSSTGAGGADTAPRFCTYAVTGAFDLPAVTPDPSYVYATPGTLVCGTVIIYLGPNGLQGPGSYPSPGVAYT